MRCYGAAMRDEKNEAESLLERWWENGNDREGVGIDVITILRRRRLRHRVQATMMFTRYECHCSANEILARRRFMLKRSRRHQHAVGAKSRQQGEY